MTRLARPLLVLCLTFSTPVWAAEITEVADAADADDPFDLEVEVGWRREQQNSKIVRENLQYDEAVGADRIQDVTELRYRSVRSILDVTLRAGLYKDLEIHGTLPIVLGWSQKWWPAALPGMPEASTLDNDAGICANGEIDPACAGDLFDFTGPDNQSYRAGLGDGRLGFTWGILNEARHPGSPSWVVGVDWTFPSGEKRRAFGVSSDPDDPENVGLRTNFFTFRTALSKTMGLAEPFVEFRYRMPSPTSRAFSNCEAPERLADMDADDPGVQNTCTEAESHWFPDGDGNDLGGFRPSHAAGFLAGAEILPYVDPENFVRLALVGSVGATYVSEGRNFSELSDALQRITWTEDYVTLEGLLGFRMQASRFAKLHVLGTFDYDTDHLVTGETIGEDLNDSGLVELPPDEVNAERNPNYDFRWDQPGRRFRVEETTRWGLRIVGEIDF